KNRIECELGSSINGPHGGLSWGRNPRPDQLRGQLAVDLQSDENRARLREPGPALPTDPLNSARVQAGCPGVGGETRTPKPLRAPDPKAGGCSCLPILNLRSVLQTVATRCKPPDSIWWPVGPGDRRAIGGFRSPRVGPVRSRPLGG